MRHRAAENHGAATGLAPCATGGSPPWARPRARWALAAAAALLAAGPASAQLDTEPKTPYLWRVVVKAQPHPLVSPALREQVRRDVAAALQPALGHLGVVEVVDLADLPRDKWDSLWQQFEDKGFAALDAPRDLNGAKTHFLTVEYRDGRYHLESRQHDGFSGLASPVVRRQSVRSPEMVGRTAGLMLDRDFGLVASADPVNLPRGQEVKELRVTVRGGQLGPLDRHVKAGDVFALSQVVKTNRPAPAPVRTATGKIIAPPPGSAPPPGYTANPRAFTLLRVTDVAKDGTLRCGVLSRYENPVLPGANVAGYRCMKLGTVEGTLAVRLVTTDPAYQKSVGLATVAASETGFPASPDPKDLFKYNRESGLFRSDRPLANVACVTVSRAGSRPVRFPVPVLGGDPVSLPFELNDEIEREAEYVREAVAAHARAADARNAQTVCFDATAKLIEKQRNADALARAKGGYQAADAADRSVSDDLTRLRANPGKSAEAARLVAGTEKQLQALREFNKQLDRHIKTLEEVVRRENDPRIAATEIQAQALNARIAVLLGAGDVEEAIVAYDQLLTLLPDDAAKKAERDRLKAEWAPKSEAHAKARQYLLRTWAAVATIPDFRDSVPQLAREVQVCIDAGDRYTLRKLLTVFSAALVKLNDLVAALDPAADAKLLDDAKKAGEALAGLEARVTEFVSGKKE